ncbi:hypothetical protein ACWEU6_09885 [Streptosporangium sandarakinum]|uniref:hypothetical protein n=1 Tax=Streptosporangium sandarakinum TaxID=1260955 RepID=UPI0036CE15C9
MAAVIAHAVSCQRRRQDGNGPISERLALVDAMNGSAMAAPRLGAISLGDPV